EYDVVVIQEPFIGFLGNTRATSDWNVIYPTQKFSHQDRSHAVTLINKCLNASN
ncbi:hypothetical protein BDR04DRAFT_1028377, partial [Suillus decipiens]